MADLETLQERSGLTRRTALAGGSAALLTAALAACGKSSEDTQGGGGAGDFPETPKYRFTFVNHVTTNPFFVPTQYGASDACSLLKCSYQWTGSKTADVGEMVNAMNTAISAKVDGIAVCLVDLKAFNGPTKKAMDAGIPVVSYNADANNDRLAYIGQDLFLSGVEMGKRIVDLVPSGKVGLFIATPGSLNIQPRIDGAIKAIKDSGKPIEYKTVATGAELNEELSRIDAWYLGNKDAKGMFAVDAGSTQSVGQVIQKYKLRDKGMKGGGYDTLEKTLELLRDDQLDFTIDQQAYVQGFYVGPDHCVDVRIDGSAVGRRVLSGQWFFDETISILSAPGASMAKTTRPPPKPWATPTRNSTSVATPI